MKEQFDMVRKIINDPILKLVGAIIIAVIWYFKVTFVSQEDHQILKAEHGLLIEKYNLSEQSHELEDAAHQREVDAQKVTIKEKVDLIKANAEYIIELRIMDARYDERIKFLNLQSNK